MTKQYRKTIIYKNKRRATANYVELTPEDWNYVANIPIRFFERMEGDIGFVASLLQPAHLGKLKDRSGDQREKTWLDFLSGMFAKSLRKQANGDPEDFSLEQLKWMNRLLAHVGELQLELVESDEDIFTFGKRAA